MKALLIDLDGVVYQGDAAVPGAAAVLRSLRDRGIPHLFVTNTTSRSRDGIVDKLAGMGIEAAVERILTPPVAARAWISAHVGGPLALFVPDATRVEFEGADVLGDDDGRGAGAVVIGDLGEGWSFATLNRAFRLLMDDPQPLLIALGMTRYWRAPDGLRLDVAPFVKALEYAAGCRARVLGKPSPEFFDAALDRLGAGAADTLMVGDDIVGDVQGAQRRGLKAALVKTGKFMPRDLEGGIEPDFVLESIADAKLFDLLDGG